MTVKEMLVTPAQAVKWLEGNTLNRSIRDATVERYARDMREGRWKLTHEAIAFDPDKTLIDGQHRLWAIIKADVPIKLMVAYDVSPEARAVINSGLTRTDADHLKLGYGMDLSNMHTGIAKRMLKVKLGSQRATTDELKMCIDKHLVAINFAIQAFGKNVRGVTTTPVIAVLARAYYHVDQDKLQRFAELLCYGRIESMDDEAALLLRSYLLERLPKSSSSRLADTIYAKTERALLAYTNRERISILYPAANELFPLPEEKTQVVHIGTKKKAVSVVAESKLPGKAGAGRLLRKHGTA